MKKFKVNIEEKLSRTVEVDAETKEKAIEIVNAMYDKEEVILNADDYISTEINHIST